MNIFRLTVMMLTALIVVLVFSVGTMSDAAESVLEEECECFIAPVPLQRASPVYPRDEIVKGNVGMVEIELMVDVQGSVYEPIILRSTSKGFERAALAAIKEYKYRPAKFKGRPVASRTSIRLKFEIDSEADGVNARFAKYYQRATTEIEREKPDVTKLDRLMKRMINSGNLTYYALARYYLVAIRRALHEGKLNDQIEATRSLLLFDQGVGQENRLLDTVTLNKVKRSLFYSLVKTQRFSEAWLFHRDAVKQGDPVSEDEIRLAEKIEQSRHIEGSSLIKASLGDRGYVVEHLFKNTLAVIDIQGAVNILKFRCDTRFETVLFRIESDYQIPESWGKCLVEIVGTPNTKLGLYQY